jgi:hypothetical protein
MKVAAYAAILAALIVAAAAFAWNVTAVPWRMHQELLMRLQAFERRRDVGRLVQLRERGVQLLGRRVPIVERAHHDMSDQELSAYLAADNRELLVYQMTRRLWEEETAAELEKCATRSEVSSFRVIENRCPRPREGNADRAPEPARSDHPPDRGYPSTSRRLVLGERRSVIDRHAD